jgi:hypothetical protein
MSAAAVIGWMSFLSLHQLAVTSCWCGSSISFLCAVLVQVSTTAPKTVDRLFAISPDVAKLLAVVALGKSIMGSISLHPDSYVAVLADEKFPGTLPSSAELQGTGADL